MLASATPLLAGGDLAALTLYCEQLGVAVTRLGQQLADLQNTVRVGDYQLIVDADGGLKVQAPDGTKIALVTKV